MNSEKYMNSKKSFLFTTFFLLVLQDASFSLSLQMLCLQDTIYKLYLHTWPPSHCTLCLFACLLIKIQL